METLNPLTGEITSEITSDKRTKPVIRILITEAAFNVMAATLLTGAASLTEQLKVGAERYGPPPDGMVPIFLPKPIVEALKTSQLPGEDYSETILRALKHERERAGL